MNELQADPNGGRVSVFHDFDCTHNTACTCQVRALEAEVERLREHNEGMAVVIERALQKGHTEECDRVSYTLGPDHCVCLHDDFALALVDTASGETQAP